MPELAEVQTLAEQLHQQRAGATIEEVTLHFPGWIKRGDLSVLAGDRLDRVQRWGKRLRFSFASGREMVVGLGMTGSFRTDPQPDGPHLLARFRTSAGDLCYLDPRRFGSARLFEDETQMYSELGERIGIDAAAELTDQQLAQVLGGGRRTLKAALLDQARLSGIGNYLADEMAFAAGLRPSRPLKELSDADWSALNRARIQVIDRALSAQGLSFSDYRHADGQEGRMSQHLLVYGRGGNPCLGCGTRLSSGQVAGRTTVWCARCQT